MSILPFVAIDGGPYRQRRLSGSPHWRPPPTRFLYSSKHAADTHNKPLIKACFWSRFEKTKVAIWSWICLCVYACVCERDRQRQRVYESERAAQVRKKTLLVLFSVTSPEYSALSLPPIDSQKLSIGWQLGWTGVEFSGTVNFPGTFFFFSFGPCDLYHLGFHQAQNQYIYILRDLLWGISLYYCGSWQSNPKICRASIKKRWSQAEWGCVGMAEALFHRRHFFFMSLSLSLGSLGLAFKGFQVIKPGPPRSFII